MALFLFRSRGEGRVCLWIHTHTMGKKTVLHRAAAKGESEELQQLLDTGAYDVNEGDEENVC